MNDRLENLVEVIQKENLFDRKIDFETRYKLAIKNKEIKKLMTFEDVKIDDFTNILNIKKGKLYVIREDLNSGVDNHKKNVVGGLILRGILQGKISNKNTLIDGGNYNSAKALRYYTELFGMQGIYVMSKLFPKHIIDMLETENFSIIKAPSNDKLGLEREFYDYLFHLMKDSNFRKNKHCLWHAKYGGKVHYPFGVEIGSKFEKADYIVSCLGSGGTLEGLQIPFKEKLNSKIIIGEHELSPLFSKITSYSNSPGSQVDINFDKNFYAKYPLPHMVIGPHYDEINPLLSKKAISKIDKVIQYSEDDWMSMQKYLFEKNIFLGNSSCANLNVAASLSNKEEKTVVTIAFEPFRDFYKR